MKLLFSRFATVVVLVLACTVGCGGGDENAPPGNDGSAVGSGETCVFGASIALADGTVGVVGQSCGDCGDGIVECLSQTAGICTDATALNACGQCSTLAAQPGSACGECGTWTCTDGGVECDDRPANSCGGCTDLDTQPGAFCTTETDEDGTLRCTDGDTVRCLPLNGNGCGGDAPLPAAPGTRCGTCERGVWACVGADEVECRGAELGVNSCGGCGLLQGEPASACDRCGGEWTCTDGGERVFCDRPSLNACGGCEALVSSPGETCSDGGTTYCSSLNSVSCGEAGGNQCGGVQPLAAGIGSACGACGDGQTICAGPESTRCIGASATNACGGCGFLPYPPDTSCGPAGNWTCVGTELVCVPEPNGNACGGLSALAETVGAACGTCDAGTWRCDGNDSVVCAGDTPAAYQAWPDTDGDEFGDSNAESVLQCELVSGFVRNRLDCDDGDSSVSPTGEEICDNADNNCDGLIDNAPTDGARYYRDADRDGAGDESEVRIACAAPDGWVATGADCDDNDPRRFPDAEENDCADPVDYNCDGVTAYEDLDNDGVAACEDCDDADRLRYPGRVETCDGIDNDCSGEIDDFAIDASPFYADNDQDERGDPDSVLFACDAPDGYVAVAGDCNDNERLANDDAQEVCDGVDNNCDGRTDPPTAIDAPTWYVDADLDGYGDEVTAIVSCEGPAGSVLVPGDCDDTRTAVNPSPGNTEFCDFLDNDCDGETDEADAEGTIWFADQDRDGHGSQNGFVGCVALLPEARPTGTVDNQDDCDDTRNTIGPFATEIVGDGVDQDCDGVDLCYVDGDGDGFVDRTATPLPSTDLVCRTADGLGSASSPVGDCEDVDPTVNPGRTETPGEGGDENCDGVELCYPDLDRDGFRAVPSSTSGSALVAVQGDRCLSSLGAASAAQPADDCDDMNPLFNPLAVDSALDDFRADCDDVLGSSRDSIYVSSGGSTSSTCGDSPANPCGSLSAAQLAAELRPCGDTTGPDDGSGFPLCAFGQCEILVATGTYQEGGQLELCKGSKLIGGFDPTFTSRTTDPSLTRLVANINTVDAAIEVLDTTDVFIGFITIASNVQFPWDTQVVAAPAVQVLVTGPGELTLDTVIIEGGLGPDAGSPRTRNSAHGGASIGVLARGPSSIEVINSVFRLGRGGNAAPGTVNGDGGPVVGIAVQPETDLLVDAATSFVVTETTSGGLPGPDGPGFCAAEDRWVPGLRCMPARSGEAGVVLPVFAAARAGTVAPLSDEQRIFSLELSSGGLAAYNLFTTTPATVAEMVGECAQWGGNLVTFDDEAEVAQLADALLSVYGAGPVRIATGFVDDDLDLVYDWQDGTVGGFAPWAADEPSVQAHDRCALATRSVDVDAGAVEGWQTDVCSRREEYFVCQRDYDGSCVLGAPETCDAGETCVLDPNSLEFGCVGADADARFGSAVVSVNPAGAIYELMRPRTWSDALDLCQTWGGRLADPRSVSEELAVEAIQTRIPDVTRAWIALRNTTPDDVFLWQSGAPTPPVPAFWLEGARGSAGRDVVMEFVVNGELGAPPESSVASGWEAFSSPAHVRRDGFLCERNFR